MNDIQSSLGIILVKKRMDTHKSFWFYELSIWWLETEEDKVHKSVGSRNQEGNKNIDASAKNRKLDMI